jgi:hypothetical protein
MFGKCKDLNFKFQSPKFPLLAVTFQTKGWRSTGKANARKTPLEKWDRIIQKRIPWTGSKLLKKKVDT